MASSEPLDIAVPVANQFSGFSFILAYESPFGGQDPISLASLHTHPPPSTVVALGFPGGGSWACKVSHSTLLFHLGQACVLAQGLLPRCQHGCKPSWHQRTPAAPAALGGLSPCRVCADLGDTVSLWRYSGSANGPSNQRP